MFGLGEARMPGIENDLRHAFMVAEVDEYQTAVIATAIDPAAKLDDLARIGGAQGAARKLISRHELALSQRRSGTAAKARVRATSVLRCWRWRRAEAASV